MNSRVNALFISDDDGPEDKRPRCTICQTKTVWQEPSKHYRCPRCFTFYVGVKKNKNLASLKPEPMIKTAVGKHSRRRTQDYPQGAEITEEKEFSPVSNEWSDID